MKQLLVVTAVLGSLTALQATPVVIDDFGNDQLVLVMGGGANPKTVADGIAAPNAIGGARTITLTRTGGSGLDYVDVSSGAAFVGSGTDSVTALFTWDGDTDPTLNALGLGGVDLTSAGANTRFYIALRSDLAGAPVTVTIYTDAGNASQATVVTPGGGIDQPYTPNYILFNAFTNYLGGGANFANVGAVTILVDGSGKPGLDTQLDLVEAISGGAGGHTLLEAPEPSTIGLIGMGLALTFLGGKRKS